MNNLIGAVLCGGRSKRMGKDKGLLLRSGKPWAVLVAEQLQKVNLSVVISINESQEDSYQKIFPETQLLIDNLPIDGPLDGLLSVHKRFPDKDILLMACDLVDMNEATIETLIKTYLSKPQFDYYVYQQNGFTQPFCAIYTRKALAQVYQSVENKTLKKYSLHDRFESGNTLYLPVQNDKVFKNYNKPE